MEEPDIKPYTRLQTWIDLLSSNSNIPAADSPEYLFSKTINQSIRNEPWKTSEISTYLKLITDKLAMGLSTDANYTTHCFRRGGAQHRFFYAKNKWNLTEVKAWGGWSKGERNNTIVQYLLDDYMAKEMDSTFLCSPFRGPSSSALDDDEQGLEHTYLLQRISSVVCQFIIDVLIYIYLISRRPKLIHC